MNSAQNENVLLLLEEIMMQIIMCMFMYLHMVNWNNRKRKRSANVASYSMIDRIPEQIKYMNRLTGVSEADCITHLRMDRNAFGRFCLLLKNLGGLVDGKHVSVEEQIAMFLSILAHHEKNRVVKFSFLRSGETVSRYVHLVLKAILKIHSVLLARPVPVPDDSTNTRWKWFKGCLGALDGTYINIHVPIDEKGRYRTRKGGISTNVLGVCDRDMKFVYLLPGWEGSASDARVLRDAINRPNGLKVPNGNYYLCDNGYANSKGFLAPYRGVRYHLNEWGPASARPTNAQEHFNMRHTRARNCIERAFGILKMRWGILRSASFYPIRSQIRLIMACFMIHNYIRNEMVVDPSEQMYDATNIVEEDDTTEYIQSVESTPEWSGWRDELAQNMWVEYQNGN